MPHVPANALPSFVFAAKAFKRPFAFTTLTFFSSFLTANPDESYPLYSSFSKPSKRIGAACCLPVNPTIPHISKTTSHFYNYLRKKKLIQSHRINIFAIFINSHITRSNLVNQHNISLCIITKFKFYVIQFQSLCS